MGVFHFGCSLAAGVYLSVGLSYILDRPWPVLIACAATCVYVIWRDR